MPRVLVVDDVPDNVELLASLLEDQGYEVLKAFNGIEALEVARSSKPDVIMLDIMMPGIDGIEVCRRLKANPELRSIAVILVSASEEDSDLMKGHEAGAEDYIVKPYRILVALARVQIAVARARSAALWKLTSDALREREQRFQAIFNQTFQFMGLLDPRGMVLEVNAVALEWIEAGRESVIGRPFWKGPWWDGLPRVQEELEAGVADAVRGQIVKFEAEQPGKFGEPVDVDFALMPVTDESGRVLMLLVVGHDITHRKRAAVAMCEAKEAAESASRAKGEFLANVSHEIRTPMNAILGMTELTLDSNLNGEQRVNLEIVRSATGSLLSVINDLLDFSKMEAGKLVLDPVEFGLRGQIADVVMLLGRRIDATGIELVYRVNPAVPDQLIGDPARLRQILVNLIGNAIKFTEHGKVIVDVDLDAETRREGNVQLHFRVTDSGVGIPADRREAVFAAFTQADGSTTRKYGGTGLGLAISSQLVSLMGGRIWVESEVGRGSTFHFTANLAQPVASRLAKPALPDQCLEPVRVLAPPPATRALLILMAEDNLFNQRVALLMLTKLGHTVTIVFNGREAVRALERQSFDLVLMDLQMPEMDGLQATVAIRLAEAGTARHLPIIALTAHAMTQDRVRCLEAGMDDYVSKPIQQDELRQAIDGCLILIRETAEAKLPESAPESQMDVAAALVRVDGDRVFLGEMVVMFRDEAPRLLAEAQAGIESADAVRTGRAVHSLKNWIANFVAPSALASVQELEAAAAVADLAAVSGRLTSLRHQLQKLAPELDRLAPSPKSALAGAIQRERT